MVGWNSEETLETGAMLEEPPKEGAALKIIGSSMMAHAATKEEVLEMLKKDIYATSGVWDLDKVRFPLISCKEERGLIAD
jgi:uncharacterized protein